MKISHDCLSEQDLSGLFDGGLSPAREQRLRDHIDQCDHCAQRLHAHVGDERWWEDARQRLGDLESSEQLGECAAAGVDGQPNSHLTSLAMTHIKQWLSPTDDPERLGRVGRFETVGLIGVGGAGIVLKAFDPPLNRFVAIKTLLPALAHSAVARQRFERESQAVAAITHQNVVSIHTVDHHQDLPYIAMQYVAGCSLQYRIERDGPLKPIDTVRIAAQISRGLAAAHAQGVIHRDIKPSNIMLEEGGQRVLVTDFGLARVVDDASSHSGVVAGTPQFMSPEQCTGQRAGLQSDQFSLGSVIYAMCAGRAPFRDDTLMGTLRKVCDVESCDIRESNPEVPVWLTELVKRLHRKKPEDRFETATQVAEILERELAHMQNPTAVEEPNRSWIPPMPKRVTEPSILRRFVMPFAAAAGGALTLFAFMHLPGGGVDEVPTLAAEKTIVAGDGTMGSEHRRIKPFGDLHLKDGVTATITQGKELGVQLVGDSNLLKYIRTRWEGGLGGRPRLVVDIKTPINVAIHPTQTLAVIITNPSLELLRVEDDCDAKVEDFSGDDFQIVVSDNARLVINGKSRTVSINADDDAQVDANDFVVEELSVKSHDNAWTLVNARKLKVDSWDAAQVRYVVPPDSLTADVREDARIHQVDERGVTESAVDVRQ